MQTASVRHFFVTGTDTSVGKTYFSAWLLQQWRACGRSALGLKPMATGDRKDAESLVTAAGGVWTVEAVNPIWFPEPSAPLAAARAEGTTVDMEKVNATVTRACAEFSHVVIEGVGGWRVPLTETVSVREWAQSLGLPVLVVARPGLGTLNHTLLTVESIQATGLTCAGVVLNSGLEPKTFVTRTNLEILRASLSIPVWDWTPDQGLPEELK